MSLTHKLAALSAVYGLASSKPTLAHHGEINPFHTISTYDASFGSSSTLTTVSSGVTYWLNGGSTHNFYGNVNNAGNIIVSQTAFLEQDPTEGGQTSDWVGHDQDNGNLLNSHGALIQLNDIGSYSAPTYDWYIHSMVNNGTIQWCGRGDTGGSTYQMYCDLDSVNNGLISFEQVFNNLGASFVWRNPILSTTAGGANIYNNGNFRLINTVYHNVQNIYGNGCWQISVGGVLYLEDGTGVYQNPTAGPSFPGQSILFNDPSAVLHMDTAVYSRNSNFGAQVYGFGSGNAIEFYQVIQSFQYSATTGVLNVKFWGGYQVNIGLGLGYSPTGFYKANNPQHYNIAGYNAIFYRGSAPSQNLPSQCAITAPVCSNLGNGGPGSSSSSAPASSTPVSSTPVSSGPASSTPASSTPVSSGPASSTPVSSGPASSTPVSSGPASSTPASSSPVSSGPASSTPASSTPVSSGPASSTPVSSGPASSTPVSSGPASSTPVSSTPVSSGPASSTPASSTPASSGPASSIPVSSTPASSTPVSSGPASSTPASSSPVSSGPASSTPVSSSPVSSSPASSTPVSSTPVSSGPASSTPASSTPASSGPATTCGTSINLSSSYTPYYPAIATGYVTVAAASSLTASAGQPCPTMPEAGTYCGFLNPEDACAPQPDGYGPVPTPDTASAFQSDPQLQGYATDAPKTIDSTDCGYEYVQIWSDLQASAQADDYLTMRTFQTYNATLCAAACDQTSDCLSFNVYAERDPSVNPTDNDNSQPSVWGYYCPNPPSMTTFQCTLWGTNLTVADATNQGSYREQFHVVITASDGYVKELISS